MSQDQREQKKRLNLVPVDEETFNWLIREANGRGLDLREFAGVLLDEARLSWKEPTEEQVDRQMFWNDVSMRQRLWRRRMAMRAAALYVEQPDERNAELLGKQVELAGLDYEEVLQAAETDPFHQIVAHATADTKFGACMTWLPRFLEEHNGEVAAAVAVKIGEGQGFSSSMIERVRRRINSTGGLGFRIVSHKVARGWAWRLEPTGDAALPISMERVAKITAEAQAARSPHPARNTPRKTGDEHPIL